MTVIAAMTIEATTDSIVQSRGFDESSFIVIFAGAVWSANLAGIAAAPGEFRQVVVTQNNSVQNLVGNGINLLPPFVQPQVIIISLADRPTGGIGPLTGPQAQVYITVSRMFQDFP